ncbi:MAG: SDR family NAD(P)-dependent oxidoreductase [Streptomycetaceae bacterium]|nr:SDR family NAD(P)-dependent oxidoreductase [Streptomycetaceae bacterium]
MATWSDTDDIPDLDGKTAVVTGANSGLGYVTARELARHGATVVLACRDAERAEAAEERIINSLPDSKAKLGVLPLDLADLASVRDFADVFGERYDGLDILVNNAGVMALPPRRTADDFEMQMGTNHLGHFALTALLAPRLLARPGARVVTVSSGMHAIGRPDPADLRGQHGKYHKWRAYGASKSANLMFAAELARRAEESGTDLVSVAAHPGYAATNLQAAGPRMRHDSRAERMMAVTNRVFATSAEAGALPQLYAATAPDVANGAFYGPRFAMWGRPGRAPRAPWVRNVARNRTLWTASEEATGIRWAAPLDG